MKKLLTSLLCVMMVVCFMPAMAFADGEDSGISTAEALSAAISGEDEVVEVVLSDDFEVTKTITIPAGKTVTLDLNGHSITGKLGESNPLIDTEGSLIVKDSKGEGKIVSDQYGISASQGGTITVESGIINSKYACLTSNNTTGRGNFTIKGGTLTSELSEAIYMPAQGDLLMTGGTLNGGISARMGNITIEGGTINAMTGTTDSIEDYYNYSGSVWLGDAIFVMAGTYTFDGGNACNINITGGTINGVSKSGIGIYNIYTKQEQDVNVTITGGEINGGTSQPAVKVYNDEEVFGANSNVSSTKEPDTTIVVTGGMFSDNSAKDYVPANTDVIQSEDGKYVLAPAADSEAQIGNVGYATLEAAVEAANANDTITLLKNVELESELVLRKAIVLDGANHKITYKGTTAADHLLELLASATVKNVTLDSNNTAKGVNTYANDISLKITFENVTMVNSAGNGLTAKGGDVTLKKVSISGCAWTQSVDISSSSGLSNGATLKVDDQCTFGDAIAIVIDNPSENEVATVEPLDATKLKITSSDETRQWNENEDAYTKRIFTITKVTSTGGYVPTTPTVQKPVIEPNADVTTALSTDGTTLTIKANDGYEITDVTVNGVSKGAVTTLTGLKTGDKVVITTQKTETPDDSAALIEAVKNVKLVARSAMSKAQGKTAVKITWYATDGSDVELDGVEIFRSTKRYSGYGTTPIFTTAKAQYHNTAIKKGTKYYYKVRGYKVINGEKVYTDWSTKAWRTVK